MILIGVWNSYYIAFRCCFFRELKPDHIRFQVHWIPTGCVYIHVRKYLSLLTIPNRHYVLKKDCKLLDFPFLLNLVWDKRHNVEKGCSISNHTRQSFERGLCNNRIFLPLLSTTRAMENILGCYSHFWNSNFASPVSWGSEVVNILAKVVPLRISLSYKFLYMLLFSILFPLLNFRISAFILWSDADASESFYVSSQYFAAFRTELASLLQTRFGLNEHFWPKWKVQPQCYSKKAIKSFVCCNNRSFYGAAN